MSKAYTIYFTNNCKKYMDKLEEKIKKLPSYMRNDVEEYVDKLLTRGNKSAYKFKFDWEGGLSSLSKKFTSVELQHKSQEYR